MESETHVIFLSVRLPVISSLQKVKLGTMGIYVGELWSNH